MNRLIIASCLAAGLVNTAGAGPSHATQDAALAKDAETIKLYCGNPQLAMIADWPAFENLDYQVLIAGEEGGDPTAPDRAADPAYVAAARTWILTGVRNHSDLPGGPIGGRGGIIVETFQQLCRDHAEMRPPASRITKIVLEPITDLKYLSNKDAIAFARRTNDWSGVHNAMYETLRDDAENYRTYYLRWVLKGSTLTVTFNIMSRSGVADDYVKIMQGVLDNAGDGNDRPAPAEKHRAPPPPPSDSDDSSGAAPQCPRNDRKCAEGWGPGLNCTTGTYAGLPSHSDDDEYPRGALVYQQWVHPEKFTEVYRCSNASACRRGWDESSWTQIGHCESR